MKHQDQCFVFAAMICLYSSPALACDLITPITETGGLAGPFSSKSIGICGSTAIVGSSGSTKDGNDNQGQADLYDISTGDLLFSLISPSISGNTSGGIQISINQSSALVPMPSQSVGGKQSGAAYVYNISSGELRFIIEPEQPEDIQYFGLYNAMDESTILMSDYFHDRICAYDAATGQLINNIPLVSSGRTLAISGSNVIVGAPYGDTEHGINSGAVYIYDLATGALLRRIIPDDGEAGDEFGRAIAVSGSRLLVGAPKDNDLGIDSGSVYLFDMTSGEQLLKLHQEDDYPARNGFGKAVAIDGAIAVVGAAGTVVLPHGTFIDGVAHIIDLATTEEVQRLDRNVVSFDFGRFVGISGKTVIVGNSAGYTGEFLELSKTAFLYDIDSCVSLPCNGDINGDGIVDSADLGVLLSSFGSTSPLVDINSDGVVDTADLGILLGAFGTTCP